jgi:hypothetical protein
MGHGALLNLTSSCHTVVAGSGVEGALEPRSSVTAILTLGRSRVDSRRMGIAVLDPLQVEGSANALAPRDRVVLSGLAVRAGTPITQDALADALWVDEMPAAWTKVVQGCVVRPPSRVPRPTGRCRRTLRTGSPVFECGELERERIRDTGESVVS